MTIKELEKLSSEDLIIRYGNGYALAKYRTYNETRLAGIEAIAIKKILLKRLKR
jgi:hypothetical protein